MALTRQFLLDLGLEKDVLQKILDEHGETIKTAKLAAKEEAEEPLNKKIKKLEGEKATLEAIAKDAPTPDGEDWKQKYDDEVKAHQATKDGYVAEKDGAETASLLKKALEADGANPKVIDLLLKEIDPAATKKKDGKLENWEDLSKPIKERYADFFGTVEQQGANVGNPLATNTDIDPFIAGFKEN